MTETTQSSSEPTDEVSRLVRFGRRHPTLTIVGLAGAALIGGLELAAGVVVGAGVAALVRRRAPVEAQPPAQPAPVHTWLDTARERAHAVLLAARGKSEAAPS